MNRVIKRWLKYWLPPALTDIFRASRHSSPWLSGDYLEWSDASANCGSYTADAILEKVLASTQKVRSGEAMFERDSVAFDSVQYAWPLSTALMWVAAQNSGILRVLDFGGALGSSYFQNKLFIDTLRDVRWGIVEQPNYVHAGNKYISDQRLRFYVTIDECYRRVEPNIVILSSVLQYLRDPFGLLRQIADYGVEKIVIDRTPILIKPGPSKIKVQHVPPSIYKASYPCWLFARDELFSPLVGSGYGLAASFDALDELDAEANWRGFIFLRSPSKGQLESF